MKTLQINTIKCGADWGAIFYFLRNVKKEMFSKGH